MGFLKNWFADRNSGKLEVAKGRVKDIEAEKSYDKSEKQELDRLRFQIGVRKSRNSRYNAPKSTTKNISKSNVDSHNTEIVGVKTGDVNAIKVEKNKGQPQKSATNPKKITKPKK